LTQGNSGKTAFGQSAVKKRFCRLGNLEKDWIFLSHRATVSRLSTIYFTTGNGKSKCDLCFFGQVSEFQMVTADSLHFIVLFSQERLNGSKYPRNSGEVA